MGTEPQPEGTTQGVQSTETINPDQGAGSTVSIQSTDQGGEAVNPDQVGAGLLPTEPAIQPEPSPPAIDLTVPTVGEGSRDVTPDPVDAESTTTGTPDSPDSPDATTTTEDPVPTTVLGIPPGTPSGEAQAIVDERARLALVGEANTDPLVAADPDGDCTCIDIPDGYKAADPRCPVHGEYVMNRVGGIANRDARLGPLTSYLLYLNGVLLKVPADDAMFERQTAAA